MPCVTLLVTGVPRNARLADLSRNLALLFDTDEFIGTFKLRNLPNHPRTNKRQIAVDFRSGFDAMAAQAKLDTCDYEYDGEMYTLNAKVNKVNEYMRSGSFSPERNDEDENWRWSALRTIPDVCYDDNMYRATHSKLNAHLSLLRKQKLIVEAERELLREKRKLKREYGSTDGYDSKHEATTSKRRRQGSKGRRSGSRGRRSGSRGRRSGSRGRRSGSRGRLSGSRGRRSSSRGRRSGSRGRRSRSRGHRSGSRGRRSRSRGHRSGSGGRRSGSWGRRSGSRRQRSKSREGHVVRGSKERVARSRDRSRPRLALDDRTRQLRSRSKDRRSQSHETHARDRSVSREIRDLTSLLLNKRAQSKSRERSSSDEKVYPKTERPYRDPRSRERYHGERRSQSYERDYRDQIVSWERDRERRSMSKESDYGYYIHSRERVHRDRRAKSRSRYTERRSKNRAVRRSRSRHRRSESWDRSDVDDVIVLSTSLDCGVQRSWTTDYRHRHPLAIMPKPERSEAPRERSLDAHGDANEPQMINVSIFSNEDRTKNVNYNPTVKNKQVPNVPTENSKEYDGIIEAEENGTVDNTKNQEENQEKKKLAEVNSNISKARQKELKIESVTQNVKLLVLETLNELILESKVKISDSNQILLEKTLEELVRERVKPLVRRRNCDIAVVLRKYKLLYSKENDVLLIRKMLKDISKTNESPAVTHTIKEADKTSSDVAGQSTKIQDCNMQESITGVNKENELQEDACSGSNPTTEEKENSEPPKECDANIPKKHTENDDVKAENSKCENLDNNTPYGPPIIIDIDSPDKPVPKRPQFYLVIKPLVKVMKRVIVKNNLAPLIKISDLEYVLRHTLRGLLKGQGYLPTKVIKNKFRALHPKENDYQFIQNVIKDIKDGKYPVLTGAPTTGDCEDDVILIEKKYDVVTVEDSDGDDDDVTITGEQEATPQIPTHCPVDSSLEITGTANLGITNIDPEKHELAKDNPTKLEQSKPGTATHVPVVAGSTNLGPSELRPNPSPCNPTQVNSSPSNFGATEVPTNPSASRCDLVNPCSVNLDLNEPAHNPTPGSIQPGSTVFIPASGTPKLVTGDPGPSKLRLVNPDEAHSSAVVRSAPDSSNLVTGNLDTSKLLVVNRGTANPSSAVVRLAPGTSKLVTANPDTSKFRLANQVNLRTSNIQPLYCSPPNLLPTYVSPSKVTVTQRPTNPSTSTWGLIKPRSAKFTPFKIKKSPKIVEIKTCSSNLARVNSGPSNDTQVKLNPFNPAPVNPDPFNHDATELRPTNPRTSRWDLVNPSSANFSATAFRPKPGSSNSLQVIPGLYDLEQVNLDPFNVARVNPEPTNSSTNFGPVSPGACKFLPACLRPTELRPALATSKIRPVTTGLATGAVKTMSQDSQTTEKANTANIDKPGIMANTDKCKADKNDAKTVKDDTENANNSEVVKGKTGENNSNSLKVTAITIVTSLNELAAITDKTADGATMEVPIENIKEEIPFENSDTELTDAHLKLAPNQSSLVTSITDKANTENANLNGNKAIEGTEDNSRNSLKVTAITIVTSLNELTKISDKTTDRSEMEIPIVDIKEEIPFENSEETDPTLSLDNLTSFTENTTTVEDFRNKATERVEERNNNSLKVTAITIMTSLTELAAIADKSADRSNIEIPVEDIKKEIETEYSETEQINSTSKPASSHESKEVHGANSYDDENDMPKYTEGRNNGQINSSSGEGIGCIEQENSNYPELTTSEKITSNDKTASDEEETIESIVKYVQSLM